MARYMFLSTVLSVAIACGCGGLRAEDGQRPHNVYAEFFGASNLVSVNYDRRFPGTPVFGYRAGVGFSQSRIDKGPSSVSSGVSITLGVNAIIGKRASKFEIGAEIIPGLYAWRNGEHQYRMEGDTHYERTIYYGPVHWAPSCEFSIDLGYRLQRKKGFHFRVGISPCIGIESGSVYFNVMSVLPYLSFGYTIQ